MFDVNGKVLLEKTDGYAKGDNTITLDRDDIPAAGVLYYELKSGDYVATKKMIIIQ